MLRLPASIGPLLIGAAALMFAGGLNGLILPVRGAQEGFSALTLGFLGTGYATGFVAGCLTVPQLVKRAGHIRVFGGLTALACIALLLSALFISPWAWIPLRAVAGFAFAGAAQIMESWLSEGAGAKARGRVFGVYAMVNLGATTAGQMVLPLGDTSSELFFMLGAIFYALALLPTALYATHQPQPLTEARLDMGALWRNSPIAVVGVFVVGVANSAFGTLAAVYGELVGLQITAVAFFVSVVLLAGALAQVPVGIASDRTDRRYVMMAMTVGAIALSVYFIAFAPRGLVAILIAGALLGAFIHTLYPLLISHANDHAAEGDFLRTSSGLLLMFGVGAIVGPLFAGAVMAVAGPEGMFMAMMASHVLLLGFTIFRVIQRAPVPIDERPDFSGTAPARLSTPETLALDPRAEAEREPVSEEAAA